MVQLPKKWLSLFRGGGGGNPKTVVEPYPNPKNIPLGPPKVKNDPKIKGRVQKKKKKKLEFSNFVGDPPSPPKVGKYPIFFFLHDP